MDLEWRTIRQVVKCASVPSLASIAALLIAVTCACSTNAPQTSAGAESSNKSKNIGDYSNNDFIALPRDIRAGLCSKYFSSKIMRSVDPNYDAENKLPNYWEFFRSAGMQMTGPLVAIDELVFGQLAITHDSDAQAAKNAAGCVFQIGTPGYTTLIAKIDQKDASTVPPLISGMSNGIQRATYGACLPFSQGNFAGFDAGGVATQVVAAEDFTTEAASDYVFQYVTSTDATPYPIAILLGTVPSSDSRFIQGATLEAWKPS